jgi:hypothetical protein
MLDLNGLHSFWLVDGDALRCDTNLKQVAFLVYGMPDVIRFGNFKRDRLVADRAVYFRLRELHC